MNGLRALRSIWRCLANGLFVAMFAPPIAGVVFLLDAACSEAPQREPFEGGVSSVLLLLLAAMIGGYVLGIIPAFLAGLALPLLRARLSPFPTAVAAGGLGLVAFFLTTGAHAASISSIGFSLMVTAVPPFVGVAIAARLAGFVKW